MWQGLDLFNLCTSKAQELIGWQCQEIGELIGNPMPILMANLYLSRSSPLMEKSNCSRTLCHPIGRLAKPSPVVYNSKLKAILGFRVLGLESIGRGVLIFYSSSPPTLFWVVNWGGEDMEFWDGGWEGEQTNELKKALSFVHFWTKKTLLLMLTTWWCCVDVAFVIAHQ